MEPLAIKIPQRRFIPADDGQKAASSSNIGCYLDRILNETSRTQKTYYCCRLFKELLKQPVILALSRPFRETMLKRIAVLEKEVRANPYNDYTDEFLESAYEIIMLCDEICQHPQYVS